MPTLRARLRAALARLGAINLRGILAIAGIASIAVGLNLVNPALAWLAVGIFLLLAAGTPAPPARPKAPTE